LNGAAWLPRSKVDNPKAKALAQVSRRQKMLDEEVSATIHQLAWLRVNLCYMSRIQGFASAGEWGC
jgi:hypothetical protein